MNKDSIKKEIMRLIDHASVIAPSIVNFEKNNKYGRVTDEYFDYDAFISWKIESKAIFKSLSNINPELFSDLYKDFLASENKSKKWHSRSIFVHKITQLLGGSYSLIDSPLNKKAFSDVIVGSENGNLLVNKDIIQMDEKTAWAQINQDFDLTKRSFGRKLNFIHDPFKKKIIYRDVAQAYILSKKGFNKPAVIMAGSVVEELLRLFLMNKKIAVKRNTFSEYIRICENMGLLKSAIFRLSDSVRHFRNLVHLTKEVDAKHTISKATAKNAVSSIFIIANDF